MIKLNLIFLLLLTACGISPVRQSDAVDGQMNELVMYAVSLADTPYRYGGNSEKNGFDCSSFVGHVYRHSMNINLPRTSRELSRVGTPVAQSDLRSGDLVFFNTQGTPFSHVGIFIGDGKFVHAPKTGDHVRTEQMQKNYWKTRYNGARRMR